MNANDPYKTQPLQPVTQTLAGTIALPLPALIGLALGPALLAIAALLLWGGIGQAAPRPVRLLVTPTLGLSRAAAYGPTLTNAAVAYAAPGGTVVGALEPGRAYRVVARSGLAWAQIDVAAPGEAANLVWVSADDIPEVAGVAGLADLATPAPSTTPQIVYVAAPAEPAAPATPTQTYILAPATPAPHPIMMRAAPTALPCTIRELGAVLRICNGIVP
jgi:hypothetical protein